MNKKIYITSLVLSTLLLANLQANEENFIELGFGVNKSLNNFSSEDDTIKVGESSTEAFPSIAFSYHLGLSENITSYAKSQYGEFNLGSTYKMNKSELDFGFVANLATNEQWSNPFDRANNDNKSEVSEKGFYLSYSMPLTNDLYTTFKYQRTSVEYKNDEVISSLKRDGNKNIFSVENFYKGYLANINYEVYSADGKASSYKAYEFEFGKKFDLSEKAFLVALANIGSIKYDEINTELNETIDATTYGLKTKLTYNEPFDYQNTYVSVTAGFDRENANHDFYDKEDTFAVVSVGYKF